MGLFSNKKPEKKIIKKSHSGPTKPSKPVENSKHESTFSRQNPIKNESCKHELESAVDNFKKQLEERRQKEALKRKVSDLNRQYGREW